MSSDFAVVGHNPEAADLSRPNGEIIRERFYMRASNAHGDAFVWGWFETPEQLEAAYLLFAPPILFWAPTYPVYGSPAYEEYGQAEEIAWELEMAGVEQF